MQLVFAIDMQLVLQVIKDQIDGTATAIIGEYLVGAAAAVEDIRAGSARIHVVVQFVIPVATVQDVVSATAVDRIVTGSRKQQIISASAVDGVVTATDPAIDLDHFQPCGRP